MLAQQGENLVNLASDIVENGMSPSERFFVMPDPEEKKHYIVLEGNRRLTVLKILESPRLAAESEYAEEFSALAKRYAQRIKKVECVIFPDKESAFPWIQRKHATLGGRGIVAWGAPAQARAEAFKGKVRPSKAVLDFLRKKNLMTASLEDDIRRKTTNVDRVFQMPYLKKALGVIIEKNGAIRFENGKEGAGSQLILKMIKQLAHKDLNVNDIRSAEQREEFIDKFAADAMLSDEVNDSAAQDDGKGGSAKTKKARGSSFERKCLALKGAAYALDIKEPRLNRLYIEARRLQPERIPNCGAILTRVFLELTTEVYLTEFKIAIPEKYASKGKTKWSDFGIPLKDKIQSVLNSLDPGAKEKDLSNARRALSDDNYLHSVTTLHQYMHDLNTDASPKEIKQAWERWHPYFSRVFDAINKKNNK